MQADPGGVQPVDLRREPLQGGDPVQETVLAMSGALRGLAASIADHVQRQNEAPR